MTARNTDEYLVLSQQEADLARSIAARDGITVEEAATLVIKASMARRMKKRTGKNPAKVYRMPRKP